MSADHLAAPCSPLDVLEDEILISILLAAAKSESQQQHEQQQYLHGIFPMVCKRFLQLVGSSGTSILVPLTAADQSPPLFASWLTRHGPRLQDLTIPARLLAAVAEQQPPVLPSLSNLSSLQLTGRCSENMMSALQPLSNLQELQLPGSGLFQGKWSAGTFFTVSTCFISMTSISIMRPAELTSLAPLSQLTQLQQIKLQGVVAVAELQHVTGLPISSLQLYHSNDDATAITGWLGTGAATKLQEISLVVAYRSSFGEALVQSLAQLPHLHGLHVLAAPPASVVMPASDLQPLSSSTSLTVLTLGNTWDAPINIAHLPSQLVKLAVVEGGLGNLGSSEDLARRLGGLTSLQLAVLTALQSLHIAVRGRGETFSAASLQCLSTLPHLSQLQLKGFSLKQCSLDILPLLISSLRRLQFLSLTWDAHVYCCEHHHFLPRPCNTGGGHFRAGEHLRILQLPVYCEISK